MAVSFQLEVVTPARRVLSEEVTFITAPGAEGTFGVMPGHSPFLTTLNPGVLVVGEMADARKVALDVGYAEVLPERVTILVDKVRFAEEVDVNDTKAQRDQIAMQLAKMELTDIERPALESKMRFLDTCLEIQD